MTSSKFRAWAVVLPLLAWGFEPTAATAADTCTFRVLVVDTDGHPIPGRVEIVGSGGSISPDAGNALCVKIDDPGATVQLVISSEGYQAHATELLSIPAESGRTIVVSLARPF